MGVVADAPAALGVERAPQEQRRVAVAAAGDGGVPRREVLDVGGQHDGVLSPRDHHAAGDRAPQELVARDAHASDARLSERHPWCLWKE